MNEKTITGPHRSFWVVAAVALIWNVLGSINFVAQMNPACRSGGRSGSSPCWRPAVDQYFVQFSLSASWINKVTLLKHFTVVANHLSDVDRIVPAVLRTVVIDIAGKFLAVRRLLQPGTVSEILTGCGINPDFFTLDVASDIRSVGFPPVDFFC